MKTFDRTKRWACLTVLLVGLAMTTPVWGGEDSSPKGERDQQPNAEGTKGRPQPNGLQIEMNIALVSFERKELEAVARKSPSASVAAGDVLALWRAGKGRLVSTWTARVNPNDKCTVKDVIEWRYPQCYEQEVIPLLDPSSSTPPEDSSAKLGKAYIFAPADYQTRELGMIVNFTNQVGRDNKSIQMVLEAEMPAKLDLEQETFKMVTPAGTNTYFFPQPAIQNKSIQLAVTCADGETVVYNSDLLNRDSEEGSYLLITPRLVPPRP